ncbi:MAG TPA: peptidoglycan editing factor PgeF [Nitrospiria bacterium]|nr:peptidoglycan editing factor PgeF [Nitrospiria bacterium]
MQTEWIENEPDRFGKLAGFGKRSFFHFFGTRTFSGKDLAKIGPAVGLKQVHGDRVVQVTRDGSGAGSAAGPLQVLEEGDALVTDHPGVVLAVSTADCVPLLFFESRARVIGAAHAGWRGTMKGIASRVVASLAEMYGTSPEAIRVAIGPRIGPCCFEVGEEVLSQISADHYDEVVSRPTRERAFLDLAELNRLQLTEAGVPPEAIHIAALCTACHPDRFFSYRRDRGRSGNMISGIMLERS